ncbi:MAG: hypothetical protein RMJ00_06920 [Nitrososphaerota archaeon]|nr:hypothetical protein [Nitrososphaerota archaeon]
MSAKRVQGSRSTGTVSSTVYIPGLTHPLSHEVSVSVKLKLEE